MSKYVDFMETVSRTSMVPHLDGFGFMVNSKVDNESVDVDPAAVIAYIRAVHPGCTSCFIEFSNSLLITTFKNRLWRAFDVNNVKYTVEVPGDDGYGWSSEFKVWF